MPAEFVVAESLREFAWSGGGAWESKKFKRPFPLAECTHFLLPLVPALGADPHVPGHAHY